MKENTGVPNNTKNSDWSTNKMCFLLYFSSDSIARTNSPAFWGRGTDYKYKPDFFFPLTNHITTEVWCWGIYLPSTFALCKGYEDVYGSSQLNSTTEPNLNVIADLSRMSIFTWCIFSSWDSTASGQSSGASLTLYKQSDYMISLKLFCIVNKTARIEC